MFGFCRRLRRENEALRERVERYSAAKEEWARQLSKKDSRITRAETVREDLGKRYAKLRGQYEEAEAARKDLDRRHKTLWTKHHNLKGERNEAEERWQAREREWLAQELKLVEERDELRATVSQGQEMVDRLVERRDELVEERDKLQAEVSAQEVAHELFSDQYEKVREERNELRISLGATKAALANARQGKKLFKAFRERIDGLLELQFKSFGALRAAIRSGVTAEALKAWGATDPEGGQRRYGRYGLADVEHAAMEMEEDAEDGE